MLSPVYFLHQGFPCQVTGYPKWLECVGFVVSNCSDFFFFFYILFHNASFKQFDIIVSAFLSIVGCSLLQQN